MGRVDTHLELIGNDSPRAELCADLVGSDRIEIDKTEGCDDAICLEVLQILQGGHITLIRVVLPIELRQQTSNWLRGGGAKRGSEATSRPARSRGGWCASVSCARGQRPPLWSEKVPRLV